MTDEALADEWRAVEARKQPVIDDATEQIAGVFGQHVDRVVQQLEEQKAVKQDFTVGSVLEMGDLLDDLQRVLSDVAMEALRQGFQTGLDRTGANADFNAGDPDVQETIRRILSEHAESIESTTLDDLRREITQGLDENETINQIQSRVRGYMEDAESNRSRLIAQTTATAGFENGQLQSFREAGFERKRWISQRDSNVRESHEEADGQEVALEMPFTVGGASLMHPADPSGPADEVARCRCTMFPVREGRDAEGFTP